MKKALFIFLFASSLAAQVQLGRNVQIGAGSTAVGFITSLTTTGTSGPASVISGVLNIPQYSFNFTLGSTPITGGSTITAVTGLSVNGVTLNAAGSSTLFLNQAGSYTTPAGGAVNSVANSDGTLTISPTTGSVVASLNLAHANTWTAPISVSVAGGQGGTFDATEGTTATAAAGHDILYALSTTHRIMENPNNAGAVILSGVAAAHTAGNCVQYAANGVDLADAGGACGVAGGGSAWSAITGGTNTASLLVGTGGSIGPTGTGIIQATNIASTIAAGSGISITGSGTTASPYSIASTGGGSAIVASAEVVTFSATPTFSVAFNVSRIVLTANITSFTLGAGADGQHKTLCFKQGAGLFTVTPPAGVHGFMVIGNGSGLWSCQSFNYDNTDSIWLADSAGVINQ